MLSILLNKQPTPTESPHKEGELYKTIDLYGSVFHIYYGYYEEIDRKNPQAEPMPIYPDFLKDPQKTNDGFEFVTKMQDACSSYIGEANACPECADCKFFKEGSDLIGVCTCRKK